MSNARTTTYSKTPSRDTEILVEFSVLKRKGSPATITRFSVVLRTVLDGEWRILRRYDNAHGSPHMHKYDWYDETENVPLGRSENSSQVFNEALSEINRDHKKIRAWFIASRKII